MADTAYIDPYRGEGPSRAPDQRVDAHDPASTATRRLVSILIWLAAALGAALAYLAVATPLYSASTSIVLDARGSASEADAAPLTQDDNLIERQARLVSSPSVLSRVVASQNLEADPEFNAPPQPLVLLWRDILGLKPAVPPTASLEQRVLAALAERIDVKRSEGSSILDIDVGSSDPAKAARLADALAAAFVESQIAARPPAPVRPAARPDLRLREAEERVRADARRLEALKTRNPGLVSAATTSDRELEELNRALSLARATAREARGKLDQVERAARRTGRIGSLPPDLGSGFVDALRNEAADLEKQNDALAKVLGPRHPDLIETQRQLQRVQAAMREELQKVAAGLRREVDLSGASETAALRALEAKQREVAATSQARAEFVTLERELQNDKAAYLQALAEDTPPQEPAAAPSWRVLAPALLPLRPDRPDARSVFLVAAAAGIVLGLVSGLRSRERRRTRAGRRRPAAAEGGLAALPAPRPSVAPPHHPASTLDADDPLPGEKHVRRFHFQHAAPPIPAAASAASEKPSPPESATPHSPALPSDDVPGPPSGLEPAAKSSSTPSGDAAGTSEKDASNKGLVGGSSSSPTDLSASEPRDRYVRRFRIGQPLRPAE
jgi:uncharacterized protein involved in exopolysaccharide biosynthesis